MNERKGNIVKLTLDPDNLPPLTAHERARRALDMMASLGWLFPTNFCNGFPFVFWSRPMPDHRTRFLSLALRVNALRFGGFTLKSGRNSPYFFNAGCFDSGAALASLATCYADALDMDGLGFDLLFGPAYKGIPLASALACELARRGRDVPLAFNRKEAKTHGEGGVLMGAALTGRRVLIVDDVITAGTAVREALGLIADAGGTAAGIVIALDRQERVSENDARSAVQAIVDEHGLTVVAVAGLDDLLAFVGSTPALR